MKNASCKNIARKCVDGFEPYIPGRPVCEIKKKYNLKRIIKLASNENVLGPSKKITAPLKNEIKYLYLYPVGNSADLRNAIAKKLDLCPDEVMAGSGTDEIIEIIGKTFLNPGEEIVVSKHAFIRYKMAGRLMDCAVKEIPMKNYKHDLDAMLAGIGQGTKVVFIANPNNPTGTYVTNAEMRAFLDRVPENVIVCLDEAYYEYACVNADYPNGVKLYKEGYKNIIALRTFSKIYALAGLRVGYCVAEPGLIDSMDRIRPPFNVNSLAQKAAEISINDNLQVKNGQRLAEFAKKGFYRFLEKNNIPYLKSAANFVLLNVEKIGYSGREFFEKLLRKGIIVREMSEYELGGWVRITVSKNRDMDFLYKEIKKLLEERDKKCS
ncbi:MAG TPA: histidinol-phosphate transaminase [Firmicutes bacterium]|nr:histidinol-phosphate transaminase [Bacillota bacterium]